MEKSNTINLVIMKKEELTPEEKEWLEKSKQQADEIKGLSEQNGKGNKKRGKDKH